MLRATRRPLERSGNVTRLNILEASFQAADEFDRFTLELLAGFLVPEEGIEPSRRFNPAPDFKSGVSAIPPLWRNPYKTNALRPSKE